jgi:hypothetical protein
MQSFTASDASTDWPRRIKKPSPVHMLRVEGPFEVETNEGTLSCDDGFVAYDPLSGHVWPVASDYVAMHYTEEVT